MRPLRPPVQRANVVCLHIQVFVAMPLPHHLVIRGDLTKTIAPDALVVLRARQAALNI